jgi:hypothetical protein
MSNYLVVNIFNGGYSRVVSVHKTRKGAEKAKAELRAVHPRYRLYGQLRIKEFEVKP